MGRNSNKQWEIPGAAGDSANARRFRGGHPRNPRVISRQAHNRKRILKDAGESPSHTRWGGKSQFTLASGEAGCLIPVLGRGNRGGRVLPAAVSVSAGVQRQSGAYHPSLTLRAGAGKVLLGSMGRFTCRGGIFTKWQTLGLVSRIFAMGGAWPLQMACYCRGSTLKPVAHTMTGRILLSSLAPGLLLFMSTSPATPVLPVPVPAQCQSSAQMASDKTVRSQDQDQEGV